MKASFEPTLVGTWRLISAERRLPSGTTDLPYGTRPVGLVLYEANGYMSVQIMRSDDGSTPAPAESQRARAAGRSYIAYCGRYEADMASGLVRHHVEASLNPTWVGGTQVRRFTLAGDQLSFFAVDDHSEDLLTLHWQRLSA